MFRVTCWPTSSPVGQQITDKHIRALQKAFGVPVVRLFPKTVQELDEKFAQRDDDQIPRNTRAPDPDVKPDIKPTRLAPPGRRWQIFHGSQTNNGRRPA